MYKTRSVILLLVCCLFPFSPVAAEEVTVNTTVRFMNMNSSTWAYVTPVFYGQDGIQALVGETISLEGFGHGEVDVSSMEGLIRERSYSLVLISDRPLSSVAVRTDTTLPDSMAAFAAPRPDGHLYLPGLEVDPGQGRGGFIHLVNPSPVPINISTLFHGPDGTPIETSKSRSDSRYETFLGGYCGQEIRLADHESELGQYEFCGASVNAQDDNAAIAALIQKDLNSISAVNARPALSQILHAPFLGNRILGDTTTLIVQNAGPTKTDVSMTYIDNIGGATQLDSITIPANGFAAVPTEGLTTDRYYGAIVESTKQPITGIVKIEGENGRRCAYSVPAAGYRTTVLPLVMNNYYDQFTWIGVQNTSQGQSSVVVNYYDHYGNPLKTKVFRLPIRGAHIFSVEEDLEDIPFNGAVVVTTNGLLAVVAVIKGPGNGSRAYAGLPEGRWSQMPVFPGISIQ